MISTTRIQQKYDHRLRDLVQSTGNIQYAIRRGVPRSTARGWLSSPRAEVISLGMEEKDTLGLQQEVLVLRRRTERLFARTVKRLCRALI